MDEVKIYSDYLTRTRIVSDIVTIVKSCVNMENPITFSIEGKWGRGKTWIVDKIADSLKGIDLSQADKKEANKKKSNDFLVFKYNAWEKDYYDEPLLGILITIVNQLNKELLCENLVKSELIVLYDETKEVLEVALSSISKRIIGIDVVDISKQGIELFKKVKSKAKVDLKAEYSKNIEDDIKIVVNSLNRLSKYTPIIFVVDELDRCLPQYAIKTLERLHHVFNKTNSSVTIIALNEDQLKNTVEQMFGKNISFESYLRKFVNFRLTLDAGRADSEELHKKLKPYFDLYENNGDKELQDEVLSNLCHYMTAREFERVCDNALLCHKLVGMDTMKFSKDFAVAEILLFACKIAGEKESSIIDIYPTNGNAVRTNLGKYIKDLLRKSKRNTCVNLDKSLNRIIYVCAKGLLFENSFGLTYDMEDKGLMGTIEKYYEKYAAYFTLIK